MKKISLMKSKEFATYVNKNLILMKMMKMNLILMEMIKMNLNHTIRSEIIVITVENLEELLIIFII